MTEQEYREICEIIESEIVTEWVSMNCQKRIIRLGGVERIKENIKKLVERKGR